MNEGKFGDTKLDGLTVAMAAYSPGHMQRVKWKVGLYLDAAANKEQADALGQIFGGKFGGKPAALGSFIGQLLGVKSLPIKYEASGNKHRLSIPKVADIEVEDVMGPDGTRSSIQNAPFAEPLVYVAKSKKLSYADQGMYWEVTDKNSFHSPYNWKGP